ncbi:restriction endonuclease subunit S [Corynebacterium auriscanis]|uniref:restriction endonuclease subunit S n=1 Tax=Corynebacterium auriscanis TaxID=99807 RepID=UPI0024ADFD46|nr:restriction endonuclease subunit S [Corynebacterium auriscanis]
MSAGHEWPTVKLGDVLTPVRESEFFPNPGAERFVTVKLHGQGAVERGISAGKTPVAFTGFRIQAGQFIYSRIDARNGAFAIVPSELDGAVVSKDFPVFEINERRCSPRYLEHFARTGRLTANAKAFSQGATNRQRIKEETLLRFKFPLPPLSEQRRIAGVLEHSSQQIKETDLQLNSLAALRSSITERALDLRKHQMLQLNEIADIQSGVTKGRKLKNGEVMSEYPYMAVSNVKSGFLDLQTVKTIEVTNREAAKYELRPGDILLTEGGDPDKLGRGTIWRGEISKCLHQNHIFRIRLPENSPIPPDVLMSLISSRASRSYFLRSAKQTTGIASINKTQLSALPIPLLSAYEVIPLNRALNAIDAVAGKLKLRHTLLQELHASLAARAFSGQL